jgi:hypothetical protein
LFNLTNTKVNLFFEISLESFVIVFQTFQKIYKKKKINSIYSIDLIEKNISLTQNTIIINNIKKNNKNNNNNNFSTIKINTIKIININILHVFYFIFS